VVKIAISRAQRLITNFSDVPDNKGTPDMIVLGASSEAEL